MTQHSLVATPSKRERLVLAWAILLIIASRVIAAQLFHLFDDAYITFRYGRNLATGHGFVYNPGEWVLGTTAPAFGVLQAGLHWLGFSLPSTIIVLNTIFDVAAFVLTYSALPSRQRAPLGFLFAGLLAATPSVARITVGGMEMSLFILASLGAVSLLCRGRSRLAIVIAAGCCLIRPEGLILFGVLCLAEWAKNGFPSGVRLGLVGLLGLGVFVAPLFFVYGSPVPQSLQAKMTLDKPSVLSVWGLLFGKDPVILLLLPFALSSPWGGHVSRAFRGHGERHAADDSRSGAALWNRFVAIVGLWGLLYALAYSVARPKVWPWYGAPIYYVLLLCAAIALLRLTRFVRARFASLNRPMDVVFGAWAVVPLLVWGAFALGVGSRRIEQTVYEPLAKWCSSGDSAQASYAANDIGVIGYFCNGYVYDLEGLVSPELHASDDPVAVIARHRPTYLFLNRVTRIEGVMQELTRAGEQYAPVFTAPHVDLNALDYPSASWIQAYVVFQRK